jgi:hypothetical protein
MKLSLLAVAVCSSAALAPTAHASQLIDRNARDIRLAVNDRGVAMLTYRARGRLRHVLAWGAVNARPSTAGKKQVAFRLDYAGGWGVYRRVAWKTVENSCTPARPAIRWLVTACRARDGSLWAVQSWRRSLPSYGLPPTSWIQAAWELRLSHWTGTLPQLTVRFGWAYRRYHQLYGRLTYRGLPVHGFHSTSRGRPLDSFGRNVYVDTLDSAYGAGWRRENGFLTHGTTGGFCYGFYPHGSRPSGRGRRYRATVIGPGVTPDVYWEATPPAVYDRGFDELANEDLRLLLAGDRHCRPV